MTVALARGLIIGGHVAAGLSPMTLFFATTGLWPFLVAIGGILVGLAAAARLRRIK